MQLRKMTLMLAALGAMSMVLTGCPDGGRESLTCSTNADCLESEICHPGAKVCVQTCTTTADCPESAKKCEALSSTNTQTICKCSTSELCARDERVTDVELACDTTTQVCVPKCTADTDCAAGQTCDRTAGVCRSGSTGGTCNPANQPGTCSYGQICSSTTNRCEAAPQGNCSQATGAPAWNQSGSSAPVIVSASAEFLSSTNSTTECGGGASASLVTINFYAPGGLTTHSAFSDLQNHVKFRVGTEFFGVNFSRQDPVQGATQGTMKVGIACGSSRREGAIYIANEAGQTSNVVCVSW